MESHVFNDSFVVSASAARKVLQLVRFFLGFNETGCYAIFSSGNN
jgi:hypothetical protein